MVNKQRLGKRLIFWFGFKFGTNDVFPDVKLSDNQHFWSKARQMWQLLSDLSLVGPPSRPEHVSHLMEVMEVAKVKSSFFNKGAYVGEEPKLWFADLYCSYTGPFIFSLPFLTESTLRVPVMSTLYYTVCSHNSSCMHSARLGSISSFSYVEVMHCLAPIVRIFLAET